MIRNWKISVATLAMTAVLLCQGGMISVSAAKEAQTKTESEQTYEQQAVANVKTSLNIRKASGTDTEVIGKMEKGNIGSVLKKGKNWTKIKSGTVTGYVSNDYLIFGDEIEAFAKENVTKKAEVETETLRIRTKADEKSAILTLADEGDLLTVKSTDEEWVKVSTDEGNGYVSSDYVDVEYQFGEAKSVEEIEDEKQAKVEALSKVEKAKNSENSSSSNDATSKSSIRSSVVNYAMQFVGNPYVYGGNSLTNGIDCSGFTQQVMAHFGYGISRTSSAQSSNGSSVSVSNVQPGDLLFYSDGGRINHVALYIGGGQVVHASNPEDGIKVSNMYYRTPTCARSILG